MPSTYSPDLRIELIGAGEQGDRWNLTTNINIGTILEQAIAGVLELDLTSGDRNLLVLNAASDEARNAALILVGAPTSARTVFVPMANKTYEVFNDTDKAVTIEVSTDSGLKYKCPPESYSRVIINSVSESIYGMSATYNAQSILDVQDFDSLITNSAAAPKESPTFTGTPSAPTPPPGSVDNRIATTEFVQLNGAPPGIIAIWTGSVASIPTGWRLCDGSNGTPNMSGRFILGVGSSNLGSTGGYEDTTLVSHSHNSKTESNNSTHYHTGTTNTTGAHVHGGVMAWTGLRVDDDNDVWSGRPGYTASAGAHTHSFTTGNQSTDHTHSISKEGVSGVGMNMPPYYVLCYIMKV